MKLISDKNELAIRGLADFELDLTEVFAELKANKDKIGSVEIKTDSRLKLSPKVTITDGKLDLECTLINYWFSTSEVNTVIFENLIQPHLP